MTSSALASSVAGHIEPESLRGLQVEHQLVFGRRLHRKVGGLLTLEDAVDVTKQPCVPSKECAGVAAFVEPCGNRMPTLLLLGVCSGKT
jgi:hypothetical protein